MMSLPKGALLDDRHWVNVQTPVRVTFETLIRAFKKQQSELDKLKESQRSKVSFEAMPSKENLMAEVKASLLTEALSRKEGSELQATKASIASVKELELKLEDSHNQVEYLKQIVQHQTTAITDLNYRLENSVRTIEELHKQISTQPKNFDGVFEYVDKSMRACNEKMDESMRKINEKVHEIDAKKTDLRAVEDMLHETRGTDHIMSNLSRIDDVLSKHGGDINDLKIDVSNKVDKDEFMLLSSDLQDVKMKVEMNATLIESTAKKIIVNEISPLQTSLQSLEAANQLQELTLKNTSENMESTLKNTSEYLEMALKNTSENLEMTLKNTLENLEVRMKSKIEQVEFTVDNTYEQVSRQLNMLTEDTAKALSTASSSAATSSTNQAMLEQQSTYVQNMLEQQASQVKEILNKPYPTHVLPQLTSQGTEKEESSKPMQHTAEELTVMIEAVLDKKSDHHLSALEHHASSLESHRLSLTERHEQAVAEMKELCQVLESDLMIRQEDRLKNWYQIFDQKLEHTHSQMLSSEQASRDAQRRMGDISETVMKALNKKANQSDLTRLIKGGKIAQTVMLRENNNLRRTSTDKRKKEKTTKFKRNKDSLKENRMQQEGEGEDDEGDGNIANTSLSDTDEAFFESLEDEEENEYHLSNLNQEILSDRLELFKKDFDALKNVVQKLNQSVKVCNSAIVEKPTHDDMHVALTRIGPGGYFKPGEKSTTENDWRLAIRELGSELRNKIREKMGRIEGEQYVVDSLEPLDTRITQLSFHVDQKVDIQEINNLQSSVTTLHSRVVSELTGGMWLWTNRQLTQEQLIPWDTQVVNAAPSSLLWSKGSTSIQVKLPGLYSVKIAVFTNLPVAVTLCLDAEPIIVLQPESTPDRTSSFVNEQSNREEKYLLKRLRHSAGDVTAVTLDEPVSLPENASLTLRYQSAVASQAFIAIRKL